MADLMASRLHGLSDGPQRLSLRPQPALSLARKRHLFCGYGVLSRLNATTLTALGFGAFAVGSAIFLILELSQPFSGVFRIPSGTYDQMLESLR
jgi:hypothetical protein